jgi:very-short-patch-repair endonuclease
VLPYNKNLKNLARNLRKNMTDAERRLWSKVRRKQLKKHQFYRQKNIGDYIVDFYCPAGKLIIEIDGGQHYSEENILKDESRDRFMSDLGFKVLRFSNSDVFNNIEGVVKVIYDHLNEIPPNPPLEKGGIVHHSAPLQK